MMGRLKNDQGQLFYEFRLGDAVPEDHLVGSQQYGGGYRSNVDGSASGAPQDVAGTTARGPVPAKSCPSYRKR